VLPACSSYQRAGQLLEHQHDLGDAPLGHRLLQAVESNGQWVALLDWGPATWKLADRKERIGWTPQQKAQRLGLAVLKADLHPVPSWPELQECCLHDPQIPSRALVKHRSK